MNRGPSATRREAARRLSAVLAVLAGAVACANQGPPPGGPPDVEPPLIVSVSPTTMSTTPKVGSVRLKFNEVISETPKGVRNLSDLVFISPRSGEPRVSWGRTQIDIRPGTGWKPNTVYSVQIKPGLVDLRGNGIDTSIRVVFSTGGPIPNTLVQGVVFDWGLGRGLGSAVVEAVAPDSTTYQAVADSAGRFSLRHVPPGSYLLRAYADKNGNRRLDALEIWDAMSTTVTQNLLAEFYAFQHDTIGLRIADIAVQDSNRVIKITFDKPYSPQQSFGRGSVRLRTRDSLDFGVRIVQTAAERVLADSVKARAARDSAARVQRAKDDSLTPAARARRDSLAAVRRVDSIAAVERQKRDQARAAARDAAARRGRTARPLPPPDTTPPPKMNRPVVYTEVFITLDSALPPQSQFRLVVSGVRSLAEVTKTVTRTFTTAKAPKPDSSKLAKPDSGKAARPDSGKAPPGGAPGSKPPTPPPVRRDTMAMPLDRPTRR